MSDVQICIGPCCIPLWGLLPFLVGMLHQRGLLQWFKKEWVDYRWYKRALYRCATVASSCI